MDTQMIIGGVHRKYQIGVDEYILAVVCRPRSPYPGMPAFMSTSVSLPFRPSFVREVSW